MILLNVIDGIISTSIGEEIFTKMYTEESYKQLSELADKANNASSVEDYKNVVEEFKLQCKDEISGYSSTFHENIFIDNKTGKFYLKCNDVISSVPMPSVMVDRIKASIDKKIDINPLIKAWIRFLRNPKVRPDNLMQDRGFAERFFNFINIKYTNRDLVDQLMNEKGYSDEVATMMATSYSMKITNEGLLAGFKVSEEITTRYRLNEKGERESYNVYNTGKKSIDPISGLITYEKVELLNEDRVFRPAVQKDSGDAFFCGEKEGHIIRVGETHRLADWSMVNCNDNESCVKGLHVGGIDYIRGYQNSNTETHNVFVDPAHIGAIPDDSTGAIRCIQYFVCDAFSGVNGSIYHSSKYAAKTDEQWKQEKAEIIDRYGVYGKLREEHDNYVVTNLNSL